MISKIVNSSTWANVTDDASCASASTMMDVQKNVKATLEKKSVRFNDTANEYYANTTQDSEDCKPLWLHKAEYQQIRRVYTALAQRIMSQDCDKNSRPAILEELHVASCDATTENDIASLAKVAAQWWAVCSDNDDSSLGLEYASVAALSRGRKERRSRLYKRVARLQAMFPAQHPSLPDALQDMCSKTSRPGRLLAHQIALQAAAGAAL